MSERMDAPTCECGAVMEIIDGDMFECSEEEAWQKIVCQCPKCGKTAPFFVIYSNPRYERIE